MMLTLPTSLLLIAAAGAGKGGWLTTLMVVVATLNAALLWCVLSVAAKLSRRARGRS